MVVQYMVNSFEHIIDLIISLILFFLIPFLYFNQQQDIIMKSLIQQKTTHFVETVTTRGYLTKEMYHIFEDSLKNVSTELEINLEHKEKMYLMEDVKEFFIKSYSNEIKTELYHGRGVYEFNQGDYFTVQVDMRDSKFNILNKRLGIFSTDGQMNMKFGGVIRGGSRGYETLSLFSDFYNYWIFHNGNSGYKDRGLFKSCG